MGITTTQANWNWPVSAGTEWKRRDIIIFFICLILISALCLSLGYLFTLYYERDEIDVDSLLLCTTISTIGYLVVIVAAAVYLRTYLSFWTTASFGVMLGLIFLLVSSKHLVTLGSDIAERGTVSYAAFKAFVSAALLEEILKIITYSIPIVLSKRRRNIHDLCYLAVCAGCSFATIENIIAAYYGVSIALTRFIWCTITHSSDCLIGALILANIKTRDAKYIWLMYPLVLGVPVALHGSYDFVIFVAKDGEDTLIAAISLVIGAFSIILSALLFWPFRRRCASRNHSGTSSSQSRHTLV